MSQFLNVLGGGFPDAGAIPSYGDVDGPSSATDNALVRFDGTTGKLIQNGVLTEDDFTGTLNGPLNNATTTAAGSAFTNQPANDGVEVLSSDAGDITQTVTIIGTTTGTDTVVVETVTLTGTTPVATVKTDWGVILAVKKSATTLGTVTVREASADQTITAGLTAAVLSVGVNTVSTTAAYNRIVSMVASGATTKQLGLGGTNSAGTQIYDSQALTGATVALSNSVFLTVTEIYTGDLEATRTATVTATGVLIINSGGVSVFGPLGYTNNSAYPTWQGNPSLPSDFFIQREGVVGATGTTLPTFDMLAVGTSAPSTKLEFNVMGGTFAAPAATPTASAGVIDYRVYDGSAWVRSGTIGWSSGALASGSDTSSSLSFDTTVLGAVSAATRFRISTSGTFLIANTTRSVGTAWGNAGVAFNVNATTGTITDTISSGTVATAAINSFGSATVTLNSSSATTYTDAFNLFLGVAPAATGNVTITRKHALGIVDGTSADSSVTGAVVIATTLGTAATSIGLGNGNGNFGGTLTSGGNITNGGAYVGSTNTRSGPGACGVTTETTKVTTTGTLDALTLADGADGQIKRVVHDVDGGSFVLTPTTKTGFSTYTSTTVGETVTMVFVTTRGWMVVGSFGGVIA